MKKSLLQSLFCVFLSLIGFLAGNAQASGNYLFGVFPHLPPRELEKVYSPMAAEMGQGINKNVLFRSASSYLKFMENLRAGEYDIAFVQPFDYVWAHDEIGYEPLATRVETLSAIFVVLPDSEAKSIEDLRGKTIALPPEVAAVSHLTKGLLKKSGMVPGKDVTLSHHRSHVSCMQQVLIGKAQACGTAAPALRFFQHKMNRELRIIDETQKIPHSLFIVHPRVPENERAALRKMISHWHENEKGRELLKRGKLKSYRVVKDDEYDIVREMAK